MSEIMVARIIIAVDNRMGTVNIVVIIIIINLVFTNFLGTVNIVVIIIIIIINLVFVWLGFIQRVLF
jgi:hypothetical protein